MSDSWYSECFTALGLCGANMAICSTPLRGDVSSPLRITDCWAGAWAQLPSGSQCASGAGTHKDVAGWDNASLAKLGRINWAGWLLGSDAARGKAAQRDDMSIRKPLLLSMEKIEWYIVQVVLALLLMWDRLRTAFIRVQHFQISRHKYQLSKNNVHELRGPPALWYWLVHHGVLQEPWRSMGAKRESRMR